MSNYNQLILMGNVTRNLDLKYMPNQMAVADFGMATNRKWKNKEGEQQSSVCFVDCTIFGKAAEVMTKYVKKGSPLFVEGRLDYQTWESQDGGKRNKLRMIVENFQFLNPGPKTSDKFDNSEAGTETEGDIPF